MRIRVDIVHSGPYMGYDGVPHVKQFYRVRFKHHWYQPWCCALWRDFDRWSDAKTFIVKLDNIDK